MQNEYKWFVSLDAKQTYNNKLIMAILQEEQVQCTFQAAFRKYWRKKTINWTEKFQSMKYARELIFNLLQMPNTHTHISSLIEMRMAFRQNQAPNMACDMHKCLHRGQYHRNK